MSIMQMAALQWVPFQNIEACSAFTRVTACTLALSPTRDTHSEGFSYFVTSIAAPAASGWSGRRVGLTPTESAAFPRRTPGAEIRNLRVVKREIKVAAEPEPYAGFVSTALRLRRGVSPTVQQSCFRFQPAFRGGGTAADPNDWSQRELAEQPNAGLERPGRLPFQLHPDRKRSCNRLIATSRQRLPNSRSHHWAVSASS
jgi:hypothetical protein